MVYIIIIIIIIIIVHSLITIPYQNKVDPSKAKKASSIQYGHRKFITPVRVFSRILAHGNSNIEGRQRTEEESKQKRVNMEKSIAGMKRESRRPNCNSGLPSPGVATPTYNGASNLTYTYNPSTTPWGVYLYFQLIFPFSKSNCKRSVKIEIAGIVYIYIP